MSKWQKGFRILINPVLLMILTSLAVGCSLQRDSNQVVPGTVILHIPAESKNYVGSPSIVILGNGDYLASHDYFGPGSKRGFTAIYLSKDKGLSWNLLTELEQFWSGLFVKTDAVYLMGRAGRSGDVILRRSLDGGLTWSNPKCEETGILLRGQFHTAPVPVIEHAGRLWRSMEVQGSGSWPEYFETFVLSAPTDADLLRADSWEASGRLKYSPRQWPGRGWLEGNMVVDPEGNLLNLLRVARRSNQVAAVRVDPDSTRLHFDPETDFRRLPGGSKKFTIRKDPLGGRYWSITNHVHPLDRFRNLHSEWIRNRAVLISSKDLHSWKIERVVLRHPEVYWHAFQYWDWVFEDDDIIAVSRTAHADGQGGARNYHDANYLTFHRIANFRGKLVGPVGFEPTTKGL